MSTSEQLLYKIANLYYIENLNQIEIANSVGISRPKVSRLLKKARDEGIVNIQVNVPDISTENLEQLVKKEFGIDHVLVVPSLSDDPSQNLEYTARQAAKFFQKLINNNDKIGVSWGYTLLKISEALVNTQMSDSVILQISGNLDNADISNYANKIVQHFSEKLAVTKMYTLPCPVIVENPIIVDLLLHDSKISNIINQVNHIDIAFPNIGVLSEENCLWRTGYISKSEFHDLYKKGSVGCICSRFIDVDGKIVDTTLDERTISLSTQALKNARYSCVCVTSENKILPLLGCLRAGYVNVVALDTFSANLLLKYASSKKNIY